MALPLLLASVPLLPAQAATYRDVDYGKLDRHLRKEPAYVAPPLYALFVLDLAGDFRVWCVLDKSRPDLAYHDVLYIDLDGDGDLTEPGEKFTGTYDEKGAAAGMALAIRVGDIAVPGTDLVHTKFLVSTVRKQDRKGVWFRMNWAGRQEMSGGYGRLGMNTTAWRPTAAEAPVIRPCPDGPLSFATWGDDEIALSPGSFAHVNVIAGNAGSGPDTLAVVDEKFLDLERDELWVTVVAKDASGNEVTEASRITSHC